MPKIIISHSSGSENKYGLEGKIFTIGRAPDNDIPLPDGSSSNYHAVMKLAESGDFSLSDLGSTNHTRVNGKRISTRELRDGDRILFGDTLAVYESELTQDSPPPESEEDAPPAAGENEPPERPATIKAPKRRNKPAAAPEAAPAAAGDQPPATPLNNNSGCLGLVILTAVLAFGLLAAGVSYAATLL